MPVLSESRLGRWLVPCLASFLLSVAVAVGGTVVLQIQAANPSDKPQTVRVKANLPGRISTNDIINLNGLELGYDVKDDLFVVHKDVLLGPKEIEVFRVELRDVWTLPDATLKELEEHTDELEEKLRRTDYAPAAVEMRNQIHEIVAGVHKSQEESKIRSGDEAIRHIRTYESNQHEIELVRKYVGRLENLVLSTGQDTSLLGGYKSAARPRRDMEMSKEEYKTAVVRITVHNTSPDAARSIKVRRDLPPEITISDIVDPGGLTVDNDAKSGICFVHKENVELGPNESTTFEVKIRDKWNVNQYRFGALRQYAEDVLGRVAALGKYEAVEKRLRDLIAELSAVEKEEVPKTLDDKYVAFFRGQSSRLDLIEQKINRIESALRPMKKPPEWGFPVKPPSAKTTWLIIYIILGFLALMSLLFFLRWFGGSGSGTEAP